MKKYFAYIRVSTVKQGQKGVSLAEQREIVQRYAAQNGLHVSQWFEERETASKIGRPLFNRMLVSLKAHEAEGVIIHKVDRSARNRWDWAEVMHLREFGIEVHFAGESLDLNSSAGILAADIQAVMAVHYSRNLSEETKKGYYGRLKQGLCPYPAPLGYLNNGRAKVKTIDPIQGPIVREAFELYASGRYSLIRLAEELYKRGLRTRSTLNNPGGQRVGRTAVAAILSNPFYLGVLHVKKTKQTFLGNHEPLISKQLFEKVQYVLSGNTQRKIQKHSFRFSRFIRCGLCERSLIGEIHKGYVYYRCHSQHASTILREDKIEDRFAGALQRLRLSPEEGVLIDELCADIRRNWNEDAETRLKSEELRLADLHTKMERLTDAYIDGGLEKHQFEQRKTALMLECREAKKRVSEIRGGDGAGLDQWNKIVELIKAASALHENANPQEKRETVECIMSNPVASRKTLAISLRFPFSEIASRNDGQSGCPSRTARRKFWLKLLTSFGGSAQKPTAAKDLLCA